MTLRISRLLALALLAAMVVPAHAQKNTVSGSAFRLGKRSDNLVSISLFTPIQLVPANREVNGVRLNILYGKNAIVEGLDIGLVNHVDEVASGLGLGALNIADQSEGLRIGVANITTRLQGAIALGGVNHTKGLFGTQLGLLNTSGAFSRSSVNAPRQIGLFNITGDLEPGGIQIGLLNFAGKGGVFPVMPLINWQKRRGPWLD